MSNLSKVFFTKTKERGAVEFGIAAYVIVGVGMKRLAVFITPDLLGLVLAIDIDSTRVPVVFLPGDIIAAFKE
jgi:hypothetical protein